MSAKIKIIIIIIIIILAALTLTGLYLWSNSQINKPLALSLTNIKDTVGLCESNPAPVFTHDITEVDKIGYIVPPGNVEDYGNYKMFKSHSYIKGPNKVPVYTPIDSTLFRGVYMEEGGIDQYALFFDVSCEVYYLFDHIVDPPDKIKDAFPDTPATDTSAMTETEKVEVKAGELIGYSIGEEFEQWDFGVYNKTKERDFPEIDAEVSSRDRIADCPYDYFPEDKKEFYYSLFGSHLTGVPVPTLFCKPDQSQPEEDFINDKTLEQRVDELYADLHNEGSGTRARENFSDLELAYTDEETTDLPPEIRPFRYYYSAEAGLTMAICNIERTVFICEGKTDHLLSLDDFSNCEVAPVLLESDSRLR